MTTLIAVINDSCEKSFFLQPCSSSGSGEGSSCSSGNVQNCCIKSISFGAQKEALANTVSLISKTVGLLGSVTRIS